MNREDKRNLGILVGGLTIGSLGGAALGFYEMVKPVIHDSQANTNDYILACSLGLACTAIGFSTGGLASFLTLVGREFYSSFKQ